MHMVCTWSIDVFPFLGLHENSFTKTFEWLMLTLTQSTVKHPCERCFICVHLEEHECLKMELDEADLPLFNCQNKT